MNVIDRFRLALSRVIAPATEKTYPTRTGWDGSGTGFYQTQVAHKLQKLIEGSLKYDSNDPRDQMRMARLLIENIPPLKRAVQMQSDFLGGVHFGSDIPQLKDALNDWAAKMPVKNSLNTDYSFFQGMTEYTRQMMRNSLTTGMSFSEEFYPEATAPLDGIVVFDPANFTFVQDGTKQRLLYTSTSGVQAFVDPSDHFHVFGNTASSSSLWGQSMVSGAEFFGEILIQMLVSLKNNYIRYGSPIGINMFSLKPDATMTTGDFEKFVEGVNRMETAFMQALRDSEFGARSEIFGKMPGDVKFEHSTYGQGLNPMTGQAEDIASILRHVAGLTGIPVEMLSFDTGGEGFSGEKWRVLYSVLNVKMQAARLAMEPIVTQIARNYITSNRLPSRWLDAFWVEFESLDFGNDLTEAEVKLKRSEATAKEIQNALSIFMELSPGSTEAMRRYLDAVGLDIVETTEGQRDPM